MLLDEAAQANVSRVCEPLRLIDKVNHLGTLSQPAGAMWNETHGTWGPSAPQESVGAGDWSGSLLYPGEGVPIAQIEALMNATSL